MVSQMGCNARLDAETWQCQLEELLALQSVYDEDFRLLAAPGMDLPLLPAAAKGGGPEDLQLHHQQHQEQRAEDGCLDPEGLLMAGPPLELLMDTGGGGSGGRALGCFVAETLVHVDVPEAGLQLILEVSPPPSPTSSLPPPVASLAVVAAPVMSASGAPSRSPLARSDGDDETPPPRTAESGNGHHRDGDGWVAIQSKRGSRIGGGGGGQGSGGRRGGGHGRRGISGHDDHGAGGGAGSGVHGGRLGVGPHGRGQASSRRGARGATAAGSTLGAPETAASHSGDGNGDTRGGLHRRGRGGRSSSSSALHQAGRVVVNDSYTSPRAPAAPAVPRPHGASAAGEDVGGAAGQAASSTTAGRDVLGAVPVALAAPGGAPAAAAVEAAAVSVARGGDAPSRGAHPHEAGTPRLDREAPLSTSAEAEAAAAVTEVAEQGEQGTQAAAPTRVPFGASLQFLSPIRVTLALPADYPAAAPPIVELAASWLTATQTSALVSELQLQWRASGGGGAPMLFLWLDWLRSETLSYLCVRQELVLSARTESAAAGEPEGLALSLLRYSARREQEKFDESNVSCPICMEQHLGQRCVRLPECRDAFCSPCLTTHLRTQLECGAVDNMRCPVPTCRRPLQPHVLQQMLTQPEYERWEALTLQRTLDKMEDLVYCPRCREPCLEDQDHCTLCPGCYFSFCALCEEPWHPGSACLDPESRLALLEERRRATSGGSGLSAMERARREMNRLNELKNLALLERTAKQCPQCSMGVEKVEGCNKMTCSYCGVYFCWRCNQVIRGYDHFQQQQLDGGAGCVLFEQQEIDRWNARWAGHRAAEVENRGAMVGWLQQNDREVRLCHCVVCGQRNVKERGNNDIRCWSCNSHFCYLCRTWLRTKPGTHFGPGRCRQHSDD